MVYGALKNDVFAEFYGSRPSKLEYEGEHCACKYLVDLFIAVTGLCVFFLSRVGSFDLTCTLALGHAGAALKDALGICFERCGAAVVSCSSPTLPAPTDEGVYLHTYSLGTRYMYNLFTTAGERKCPGGE